MQKQKRNGGWRYPLLSGAITLGLLLVAYMAVGIYPFGDRSLFMSDSYVQYFPMYAQYQRLLQGAGESALYTLNAGFGLNLLSVFGYYLASPFNLLLGLFPADGIAEFFALAIVLKTVLSAITMAAATQRLTGQRGWQAIVTGVMYSTSMYMIAFSWNVMWLDAVWVLPLAVIAFYRMMEEQRRSDRYIPLIAYTLFSNFYTGFMVCLFMALYFAVWCVDTRARGRALLDATLRMVWTSTLGVMMAAVLLVPVYIGLGSTSASADTSTGWAANYPLMELFQRQFFGAKPSVVNEPFANLGCGVLVLLALPLYATCQSIPLRRRLTRLSLFAVMALSVVLSEANLLWHGGHYPNGLPYRYAFIYVFTLLLITGDLLANLDAIRPRQVLYCLGGALLYVFFSEAIGTGEGEGGEYAYTLSFASIWGTATLLCLYAAAVALPRRRGLAAVLVLTLTIAESLLGSIYVRDGISQLYTKRDAISGNTQTDILKEAITLLDTKSEPNDFYRIAKTNQFTANDGLRFDYATYDIFASTYGYKATQLAGKLGLEGNGINSQSSMCYMPSLDSLLGVRYFLSSGDIDDVFGLAFVDSVQHGTDVLNIYINEHALPLGFVGTPALRDWQPTEYNPVQTQNSLYSALTDSASNLLLTSARINVGSGNATVNGTGFAISGGGQATLSTETILPGRTYLYVDCSAASAIQASISGGTVHAYKKGVSYFIDVGNMGMEDTASITIAYDEAVYPNGITGNIYAVIMDEARLARDTALLRERGLAITAYQAGYIEGIVRNPKNGVFMATIAYDKGWMAHVNGITVDTYAIGNGALLGFNLAEGTHTITLRFWPQGLTLGLCISGAAFAVYGIVLLMERKARAQRHSVISSET